MTCTNRTAVIGSITFEEFPADPTNCFLWVNPSETLSGATTRESETDKQGTHGIETGISLYGGRLFPFRVEIHATSRDNLVTKELSLRKELALPKSPGYDSDDGYNLMTVTDEDSEAKQVYIRLFGDSPELEMMPDPRQRSREVSFVLRSEEEDIVSTTLDSSTGPESFDSTTFTIQDGDLPTVQDGSLPTVQDTTGSIMTVTNDGTYASEPVIIISGPTTNPVITNTTTGVKMAFNKDGGVTLLSGETLTINVSAGTIIKTDTGGVATDARSNLSLDSDWIYIQPGANSMTLFDDTPDTLDSQAQVQFRDSWI